MKKINSDILVVMGLKKGRILVQVIGQWYAF